MGLLKGTLFTAFLAFLPAGLTAPAADGAALYEKKGSWPETLLNARSAWTSTTLPAADHATNLFKLSESIKADFPVAWDWALQDSDGRFSQWFDATPDGERERRMISRALDGLGKDAAGLRQEYDSLCNNQMPPQHSSWWELYVKICEQRRVRRLETIRARAPQIIFTKRRTIHPSFFAYTEAQSDAQNERHFRPNSALCLWTMDAGVLGGQGVQANNSPNIRTLLADPEGVIRDPVASWDAGRVLFAWKKSLDEDDYHLYELTVADGGVRTITSGLGFADYEPAYLPNGDIVFASTRCVQTVDCWWTEVSNLYTCDADGRYLRRLGFDQVHSVYPQVLDDGRVIYTRWDYNDRSQMFPQALFQMNPDGTAQTEFYKNNSWFPTTIGHARGIPGTEKMMAIFTGHHTSQAGKLGILDPAKGRQENSGAQLIAPVRTTKAERIDYYGQDGELFQYPYPLTETEFLVAYAPLGWNRAHRPKGNADFGIYWMDIDGHRELLITDAALACQQPVPLVPRRSPPVRPSSVDYTKTTGTYYMQDIYRGDALAGVRRGTIKKLRAIGLEYRAAGVGNNGSSGPGGDALVCTPISIGNGSWDVKIVLGDATVHPDGSAFFEVPACLPVYFQALDERNHVVQTMRSWSTLMPGENQSCVGCHESKNTAPPTLKYTASLALKAGAQKLMPFYGPPRGFSFPKEIQPILDRHCIRCHNDPTLKMDARRIENRTIREKDPVWKTSYPESPFSAKLAAARAKSAPAATNDQAAFSLLGGLVLDKVAKRSWSQSYLNLTLSAPSDYYESVSAYFGVFYGGIVNWIGSQSVPTPLPPYSAGACSSDLLVLLEAGHYGVKLSREELDKFACWIDLFVPYCGDYFEANAWNTEDREKYQRFLQKRESMEAIERENIQALSAAQAKTAPNSP